MKRKKIFALGLVLVLLLAFTASVTADLRSDHHLTFSGGAKRFFTTSRALLKVSTESWEEVDIFVSSLSFDVDNPPYDYALGRIVATDGTYLSGYSWLIADGGDRGFSLYTGTPEADDYNIIKARFFHPYAVNEGSAASYKMHIAGRIWCTVY